MIYFLGDIHGNISHVMEIVLRDAPKAIVFLGDIQAQRPFELELKPVLDAGIDVRWIRGNHDTDNKPQWDNLAGLMHLNIDGKIVVLDGLRIAGLGGVFRGEIWYPERSAPAGSEPHYDSYDVYCQTQSDKFPNRSRKRLAFEENPAYAELVTGAHAAMADEIRCGKELKHLSSIFWKTYEELWGQEADILVTHEAPSCHPHGFQAIDELAQAMNVKMLFHGHHHDCLDYRTSDSKLGFKAYGVGFCGITDNNGRCVLPGDFDEVRKNRCAGVTVGDPSSTTC